MDEVMAGARNIHTLMRRITDMHPWLRKRDKKRTLPSPEECLAQVLALPNEPHRKSDQTAQGSESQPQEPQRPNKKAFRAEQVAKKAAKKAAATKGEPSS